VKTILPPNIYTITYMCHMEVRKPASLATSEIYQWSGLPPESYHVPRPYWKTIHAEYHSKRDHGATHTRRNYFHDGSCRWVIVKIAESAERRFWKDFVTFVSASASILAVFIIIWLIKLIINTIIRKYILHSIYGCGIHLLTALWNSVTHLLLYLGKPIKMGQGDQNEEEQ